MKKILQDYLDIRAHPAYTSAQRRERHQRLLNWAKQEDPELPDVQEMISFLEKHPLAGTPQLAERIILPLLNEEFDRGTAALFSFLALHGETGDFPRLCLCLFCRMQKISLLRLFDLLLKRAPSDPGFLRAKYDFLSELLSYAVHELPICVLDENDEKDLSLSDLALDRKKTAEKLGLDVAAEIGEETERYLAVFRAEKDYTAARNSGQFSGDFEAFLSLRQISWQFFFKKKG